MAEPRVIVGGTIAALVAADGLAARGVPVRLLAPSRSLGGGFRAMQRDGRRLELGVRLLELDYEDVPERAPSLEDYAPGPGAHRGYTALVRAWVEELAGDLLRPIAPPEMVLDGRRAPDVLFTVDLHGLREALAPEALAAICREAAAARAEHGDAGVLGSELGDMTLEEASLASHGRTLHELLIAPLAAKFVPGGAATTLASWRRKAWMALFWPKTLEEASCGGTVGFRPRRTFETLRGGGASMIVDRLLARLGQRGVLAEDTGPLRAIERDGDRTRLSFDEQTVDARRPVLGVTPAELFGEAYAPEKVRSVIAWMAVAEDRLHRPADLVHLHDAGDDVARISRGDGDAWTVELRHDLPEEEIVDAARRGLERAGIVRDGGHAEPIFQGAMPTFPVPDARTRAAFAGARDQFLARELEVEVVGGALDPTADSLNEQVVQGLRTVERLA